MGTSGSDRKGEVVSTYKGWPRPHALERALRTNRIEDPLHHGEVS